MGFRAVGFGVKMFGPYDVAQGARWCLGITFGHPFCLHERWARMGPRMRKKPGVCESPYDVHPDGWCRELCMRNVVVHHLAS